MQAKINIHRIRLYRIGNIQTGAIGIGNNNGISGLFMALYKICEGEVQQISVVAVSDL